MKLSTKSIKHWYYLLLFSILPLMTKANHGLEAVGEVFQMIAILGVIALLFLLPVGYVVFKSSAHFIIKILASILLIIQVLLIALALLIFFGS